MRSIKVATALAAFVCSTMGAAGASVLSIPLTSPVVSGSATITLDERGPEPFVDAAAIIGGGFTSPDIDVTPTTQFAIIGAVNLETGEIGPSFFEARETSPLAAVPFILGDLIDIELGEDVVALRFDTVPESSTLAALVPLGFVVTLTPANTDFGLDLFGVTLDSGGLLPINFEIAAIAPEKVIPLPGAVVFFGTALAGSIAARRRRKSLPISG